MYGLVGLFGSLVGDASSAYGTGQTNAANEQINQEQLQAANDRQQNQQAFNAVQASIGRNWSAQQVQQQEQFQKGELSQVENYDTTMSDTAMQRRVADLKAAGLNPLLAVGAGGASAPTVSAPQGAMGSAANASSGIASSSAIPMQNPWSAMGNLGGQVNSSITAAKTGAEVDLLKAQADNYRAKTDTEVPANVQYIKSMTGLTDTQAQQVSANIDLIHTQIYETQARGVEEDTRSALEAVQQRLTGQNLEVLKATRDALISSANSNAQAAKLGLPGKENLSEIQQSQFGKIINWINTALEPIGTAMGAAKGALALRPSGGNSAPAPAATQSNISPGTF